MTALDGRTTSDNTFFGPIGKLVPLALDLKIKSEFPAIGAEVELIHLEDDVVQDLSEDQKYLYQITCAIKTGQFPTELKERKIGPHSHARWLNLANRLCRIWCCENPLDEEGMGKLKLIIQFIVGVYSPMWFSIKVNNSWIEGPHHILKQLSLVRDLHQSVQDKVMKYVRSSAWNAHSESLLQTMLASDDQAEREFAVQQILKIRGESEHGDSSIRPRKVPTINTDASNLQDLIDWSGTVHEPPLTCMLSRTDILKFTETKMTVPKFPVHGQNIERCVQPVTRACMSVYGEDRRDGFIKATMSHRNIMPQQDSKQDLQRLLF